MVGGDLGGCDRGVRPIPILARGGVRRRLSSWGGGRRLNPKAELAVAGLRWKAERVKAWSDRSGGEFELAEGVVGAFADLAGDRESGHGCAAPLAGRPVEGEVRVGGSVGVHGGLDERPTQVR